MSKHAYHKLTFEVSLGIQGTVLPGAKESIDCTLADWSDGRKPFSVEMMERGLREVVLAGMVQAIQRHFHSIHGNEVVDMPATEGSSSSGRSRASIEAEKLTDELSVCIYNNIVCTTLEEDKEP